MVDLGEFLNWIESVNVVGGYFLDGDIFRRGGLGLSSRLDLFEEDEIFEGVDQFEWVFFLNDD